VGNFHGTDELRGYAFIVLWTDVRRPSFRRFR
jgi:hypothetical protein